MHGKGVIFLKQSFDIFLKQSFTDFDVVISDHSKDTKVQELCETYQKQLQIHYYKNEQDRGNSSANINNAIQKATGELIKILFQDDFLYDEQSLEHIIKYFDLEKDHWLVTACTHTIDGETFFKNHYPTYNNHIYLGKNTISSPSVLTIKNQNPLLFDKKLVWLMDCDYYKRYYDSFGKPKILSNISVVNRIGTHQITNTLATAKLQYIEYCYMARKYEKGLRVILHLIKGKIIYTLKSII